MAMPKPAGKGSTEKIKLDAAASHILEECRMVHLVAIVLTVVATALVMTPAALHRQAEPSEVSERFVWLASNMVLASMFPLAVAVGLDAYVVVSVVLKSDLLAALVAALLLFVFALLWLFLPWRESRTRP